MSGVQFVDKRETNKVSWLPERTNIGKREHK